MQLWWHILGMAGQVLEKELQVETVGVYYLVYPTCKNLQATPSRVWLTGTVLILFLLTTPY